ncbi:MAG: phosphatidylglycerol lysyltransferase domain-containing protein [Muribaculaceae bacterium]|nr:phosphatidylglycerol lysyltransferase domain-containing protein [Muribaculaceae bacterium]
MNLDFKPLTRADIPRLRPMLTAHPFRSCDFSIGGIFLWADYFHYSACIVKDTLFIKGVTVNHSDVPAFSLPLGAMPLEESLHMLAEYCAAEGVEFRLSSVPEEALPLLIDEGALHIEALNDWADYIYDPVALSTLAGKKLSKKRNHANRFAADHPDAVYSAVTEADYPALEQFYTRLALPDDKPEIAEYDRRMTLDVLHNPDAYGFEGGVLTVPGLGVVAFSFGEVIGDTLHVHIEKMDHEVAGSGETICRDFTAMMLERHPGIAYVNRQDDSGDMGLRRAKLALHPMYLLHKYNVGF